MPIDPEADIIVRFVNAQGELVPHSETEGYRLRDYFASHGWMECAYLSAEALIAAARAAYVGRDTDGIGLRFDVWSGNGWVSANLDDVEPLPLPPATMFQTALHALRQCQDRIADYPELSEEEQRACLGLIKVSCEVAREWGAAINMPCELPLGDRW